MRPPAGSAKSRVPFKLLLLGMLVVIGVLCVAMGSISVVSTKELRLRKRNDHLHRKSDALEAEEADSEESDEGEEDSDPGSDAELESKLRTGSAEHTAHKPREPKKKKKPGTKEKQKGSGAKKKKKQKKQTQADDDDSTPKPPPPKGPWSPPPFEGVAAPAWSGRPGEGKAAYVTFVGNDKYVDGALVLGWTLREHSAFVRQRKSACEVVVLVAPRVHVSNRERLRSVFDAVHAIPDGQSLSRVIPGTSWGTTFDKFYLYNLTDYAVVAFLDADIVILKNPDSIFDTRLPPDLHWIGAVPGHSSKGYFHTGAMVLRPSAELLQELLEFYRKQYNSKEDKYKFRSPNGRDGLVMRYFIDGRVVFLGDKYSSQHSHSPSVVGMHLSGTWKPWFNRFGNEQEVAEVRPQLRTRPSFGAAHEIWWKAYEQLHLQHFATDAEADEWASHWEGSDAASGTSPRTHVWMLRETKWEYVQKLGVYMKKHLVKQELSDAGEDSE
ncbi:putative UDP-glucuronate:xylan alpha-glucuronosyltransferase 4 [Diplonema papillatum]|nr:putative UDP-glucuronate:xylan alpha-glucuronosyltransferase 4 [Diplonema papillatum]